MLRPISLALVLSVMAMSAPVAAQTQTKTGGELKDVQRALDQGKKQRDTLKQKSRNIERDLSRLKHQTVKVAAAIQDHEAAVLDLEQSLVELAKGEKDKLALLDQRRGQFSTVLTALLRMARHPPEAMIAAPISPSDTVRGAILLRAAVPAIENRARSLRRDLSALVENRNRAVKQRHLLASTRAGLDIERQRLDGLLVEKTKLKRHTDSATVKAEKRVRELVKKAKNLQDLMARLKEQRKKTQKAPAAGNNPAAPQISKARGTLPYPAVGRLVGRYGQAMETGLTRKGITIETRSGAQVVVPYDGTVVFAGPFKGYGRLLIIEHGEGYHSLLAGLARIDNVIGQQVLSGEPAGVMGGMENGLPVLYVELRRNGQPINPLPWLAARKNKVNG